MKKEKSEGFDYAGSSLFLLECAYLLLYEPIVSLHEPIVSLHEVISKVNEAVVSLNEAIVSLHEVVVSLHEVVVAPDGVIDGLRQSANHALTALFTFQFLPFTL